MSPRQVLGRFDRLMDKCGEDKVAKNSRFQPERELRCAAIFLMGIGKVNGERYWLRPGEDVYRDVDVQVMRYDPLLSGRYLSAARAGSPRWSSRPLFWLES